MKEIACSFCSKTIPNEKARGRVRDDLYRLIDAPPEGEVWEFRQGDTVRCRHRQLSGDKGKITDYLVAVERAE